MFFICNVKVHLVNVWHINWVAKCTNQLFFSSERRALDARTPTRWLVQVKEHTCEVGKGPFQGPSLVSCSLLGFGLDDGGVLMGVLGQLGWNSLDETWKHVELLRLAVSLIKRDIGRQLLSNIKHVFEQYVEYLQFKYKVCCFSLITNEKSLGFGLLVWQNKQAEDVNLGSGKL